MKLLTLAAVAAVGAAAACGSAGDTAGASNPTAPSGMTTGVRDDASLWRLVSQSDPFARYTAFPNVEETVMGRLVGSEAHRPVIRVTLNSTAAAALQNGRLPAGGTFPAGSVVFKEIKPSTTANPTLYAVMLKDSSSGLAGGGWVWGEYRPDGSTVFPVNSRGSACVGCHRLERGPQNDLVRTFERQP